MKIAVIYDNGMVHQHFGHADKFKIYDVKDGKIVSAFLIPNYSNGSCKLASLLHAHGVEKLICGNLDNSAKLVLDEIGIELFSNVTGDADYAVRALLEGKLASNLVDVGALAC